MKTDIDDRATAALLAPIGIPPAKWGKDHHSTLLYIEGRCVDHKGVLNPAQMRGRSEKYPTQLKGGEVEEMHSDFDCVFDFVCAGLLETTDDQALVLTDLGWYVAGKLRRNRATPGVNDATFDSAAAIAEWEER